jgi:hypothetical protein
LSLCDWLSLTSLRPFELLDPERSKILPLLPYLLWLNFKL